MKKYVLMERYGNGNWVLREDFAKPPTDSELLVYAENKCNNFFVFETKREFTVVLAVKDIVGTKAVK